MKFKLSSLILTLFIITTSCTANTTPSYADAADPSFNYATQVNLQQAAEDSKLLLDFQFSNYDLSDDGFREERLQTNQRIEELQQNFYQEYKLQNSPIRLNIITTNVGSGSRNNITNINNVIITSDSTQLMLKSGMY